MGILLSSLSFLDVVAIDGAFYLVYGTSASTPVIGAMFALINDARLAKGKSSIGFVNPVLVSLVRVFQHHSIFVAENSHYSMLTPRRSMI
jgi:tripeptidyl-peptidase-1